jgi:VWFA-related protein
LLLLAAATAAAQPNAAWPQPTFSARVEGVRVDVLVTDGARRPVRGLQPADFDIRDNGVPQTVDVVSFGEIPLSVALAFDLSASVTGERLEHLRTASAALTRALAPVDEVALVTFDNAVSLPCTMTRDVMCVGRQLGAAMPHGDTALIDGVFAEMMVGESAVGRSLLVVFSDGLDTASWLPSSRVLDAARRSDTVAYVVAAQGSRPPFLKDFAELTGGRLFETNQRPDLRRLVPEILDEFRHRYLLT